MNLFLLDEDVEANVRSHVDLHVHKIALEAAQVLSAALFLRNEGGVAYDASMWYKEGLWDTDARRSMPRAYAPSHKGHPMMQWATDPVNYMWTLRYAVELCKEHQYRKGTVVQTWRVLSQLPRFTVHRTPSVWYAAVADELLRPGESKFVSTQRAITLYRRYYSVHKSHLHGWTRRGVPDWIV